MTDGLLGNIIQLEKRIQATVAAEEERAQSWCRRELAALQKVLSASREAETARLQMRLSEEKTELMREAELSKKASSDWCQRLQTLGDSALQELLRSHLAAILPGGDHDHPHGQS